jgi:hypothetical protein
MYAVQTIVIFIIVLLKIHMAMYCKIFFKKHHNFHLAHRIPGNQSSARGLAHRILVLAMRLSAYCLRIQCAPAHGFMSASFRWIDPLSRL